MSLPIYSSFGYVRPAKLQELQQLADVLAHSFYPPLGWKRWLYPVFHFSIYEDLKQRLTNAPRHYRCLVAIANTPTLGSLTETDQIVGTVEIACRRHRLWTFNQPKHIYLSNLAVLATYRRKGLACQLLQAAEQLAIDWGFSELYLHVMSDNYRARQLYRKMGYQVQQVETTLFSLLNVQNQRLLLKKVLSAQPTSRQKSPLFPEMSPQ